jgi:hypothetical protein
MGGALFLLQRTDLRPLVSGWGTWLLLGFVLLFSLAEIPLMTFGMRQIIGSASGRRLAVFINAAFTLFAAVYALPFLLLTGNVGIGLALAGLGLVRFVCAIWFVPRGQPAKPPPELVASGNTYFTSNSEE